MDITYYEQMLAKHYRGSDDMEAAWDARAEQFNWAQQQETPIFPEQVKNVLKKKGLLTNASVLDIGGGSGRYALPLAKEACHVTVTDISGNMLKLAQQNAEAQQLQNLSYCKLEWETANLSQLKWEQAFDLCFVSMCPAIRSPIGFRNLSAACKGYCVVNQFIRDTDLLSDYLNTELNIQPSFQPHNDREIVQAIFNLLWLDKKEPEIVYLHQQDIVTLTIDKAIELYQTPYETAAKEQKKNLKELITGFAKADSFQVPTKTTLAMIIWKA